MIIVRNGAHLIGTQLRALAAQRCDFAWEVVVADNGSTDDTVAVVHRAAIEFPVPLRVFDASEVRGVSHARNIGASAARGDLLAFCDCDDAVAPSWLRAAREGLVDADLVGGDLRLLTDPFRIDSPRADNGGYFEATFGGAVHGCNFAVRREVFFSAGGFDEALPPYGCDDTEFSFRVNRAGFRVRPAPGMTLYFRPTSDPRAKLRKAFMSAQAETVVWATHRDYYGSNLGLSVLIRRILALPVELVRGQVEQAPKNSFVRTVVLRTGNLVGYVRYVGRRPEQAPRLRFAPLEPGPV